MRRSTFQRRTPLRRGSPLARGVRLRPVNWARRVERHAEAFGDRGALVRAMPYVTWMRDDEFFVEVSLDGTRCFTTELTPHRGRGAEPKTQGLSEDFPFEKE